MHLAFFIPAIALGAISSGLGQAYRYYKWRCRRITNDYGVPFYVAMWQLAYHLLIVAAVVFSSIFLAHKYWMIHPHIGIAK